MCINYTIQVLVISMHFGGVADTKMRQRETLPPTQEQLTPMHGACVTYGMPCSSCFACERFLTCFALVARRETLISYSGKCTLEREWSG